jgi:osmotically-inducible protein OsmY
MEPRAVQNVTGSSPTAGEIDDRIEALFRGSYVNTTYLKDDSIKAKSKSGVVTLTGTVAEESHKALAEDTVTSLAGVGRVDNQLATTAEVAAESADTWMARKVKLALLFHRSVSGLGTTVSVKDGKVVLTGEAASIAQKELTTQYADDLEGVKAVDNRMTIAAAPKPTVQTAGEKLDDASVTAQVQFALRSHRSTSSVRTKVTTLDGVVNLTGIAKNAAEKALVGKLASDIRGASSVNNEMTVE